MSQVEKYLQDRKFTVIFAVTVMTATMLPYYLGFASQGSEWIFSGFILGLEDGNSYIAKMLSGAWGAWLFRTPYTVVPQEGVVAFLPYLLLGKLSSPPAQHEQLVVIYHCYRFLAGLLAITATADFIRLFVRNKPLRDWALVAATVGGGFGYALVLADRKMLFGSLPLDFISPESFGFLSLLGIPHLALARALFLWGLMGFLGGKRAVIPGLTWLLMGFLQPMFIVLGWGILGTYLLFWGLREIKQKQKIEGLISGDWVLMLKRLISVVLISAPMVLYTGWEFLLDPYLQQWSAQKVNPSPHPLHYAAAYGLMMPFLGYLLCTKEGDQKNSRLFVFAWVIAFPFLVYAPVVSQRRLAEGFWVLLCTAVCMSLEKMPAPLSRKLRWGFLLTFPSTVMLFAGGVLVATNPAYPLFRPRQEVEAFRYFQTASAVNKHVLSSYQTGNNLPAWAPVQVVTGHGPETPKRTQADRDVKRFFSEEIPDPDRRQILQYYRVEYVFWGPLERELGNWQPGSWGALTAEYDSGEYQIFKVKE